MSHSYKIQLKSTSQAKKGKQIWLNLEATASVGYDSNQIQPWKTENSCTGFATQVIRCRALYWFQGYYYLQMVNWKLQYLPSWP